MDDTDKYRNNAATTAMLVDIGFDLMHQNIRRRHHAMNKDQIDALFFSWLCRTDDHIPGDTAGAVRVRERKQ